jgi:hypothetical protein
MVAPSSCRRAAGRGKAEKAFPIGLRRAGGDLAVAGRAGGFLGGNHMGLPGSRARTGTVRYTHSATKLR